MEAQNRRMADFYPTGSTRQAVDRPMAIRLGASSATGRAVDWLGSARIRASGPLPPGHISSPSWRSADPGMPRRSTAPRAVASQRTPRPRPARFSTPGRSLAPGGRSPRRWLSVLPHGRRRHGVGRSLLYLDLWPTTRNCSSWCNENAAAILRLPSNSHESPRKEQARAGFVARRDS